MIPKSALGIAAAGAGICFFGYCVYFDRKRRNDPNFKTKLREKRRQARSNERSGGVTEFPNLSNPSIRSKFFLEEIQLGETLLSTGDIEGGIEHLSYAVVVCDEPQQLLQMLKQSLPPQALVLLLEKLPAAQQKISRFSSGGLSSPSPRRTSDAVLVEDDVE